MPDTVLDVDMFFSGEKYVGPNFNIKSSENSKANKAAVVRLMRKGEL